MTIFQYITEQNQDNVLQFLQNKGLAQNVKNKNDLYREVLTYIKHGGDVAIMDILSLHPEKDALVSSFAYYENTLNSNYNNNNNNNISEAPDVYLIEQKNRIEKTIDKTEDDVEKIKIKQELNNIYCELSKRFEKLKTNLKDETKSATKKLPLSLPFEQYFLIIMLILLLIIIFK